MSKSKQARQGIFSFAGSAPEATAAADATRGSSLAFDGSGAPSIGLRGPATLVRLAGLLLLGLVACALLAAWLGAASAAAACPNAVFRTGPSSKLPDCRAYELVSPAFTGGLPPSSISFLFGDNQFPSSMITPDGNDVVFNTQGGALGNTPGTGVNDRYRVHRTADGWVTEFFGATGTQTPNPNYGGLSEGHDYYFLNAGISDFGLEPDAELQARFGGLYAEYVRTPSGFRLLTEGSEGAFPNDIAKATGRYISPHGDHIIFDAVTKLEPQAPPTGTRAIYDKTPSGNKVVSLLPGGAAADGASYFGASQDGSQVVWKESSSGDLYVRIDNSSTQLVARTNGANVGGELTCTVGPGSATLSYQWLRNGAPIGGATSPTYTVAAADEGKELQCRVTAVSADGSTVSVSRVRLVAPYAGLTPPQPDSSFIGIGSDSIDNHDRQMEVGRLYTCNPGSWDGSPTLSYQWLRDGAAIPGATGSTYTPVSADVEAAVQCLVTGTNSNGTALVASPAGVGVPALPAATARPSIANLSGSGSEPEAGDELSCSPGTWSNSPSFAYQWLRDGAAIAGATSSTYTVAAADEGLPLQCLVTATAGGVSAEAASARMVVFDSSFVGGGETHPFLETFGSASQPSFSNAEGLAIDQSSGDLYVIDANLKTVSRYNPDGTPHNFSALGTNLIDGQGTGDGTPQGEILGGFTGPNEVQVAVDSSGGATDGNIYVTNASGSRIDIFSSTGAYLGQLAFWSEGNLGESCGVAVDSAGAVYVGDYNGKVHKYVPSGSFPVNADNTANFDYPQACTLAAGEGPTVGFIFVNSWGGNLAKLDTLTGAEKYSIDSGVTTVSVDPTSGHVYALKGGSQLFEFDASGAGAATTVSTTSTPGGQGGAVRGSTGNVYVSTGSSISVYGPAVPVTGPQPPALLSAVTVSGTPRVGESLNCGTGSWSGAPTFTRQWLREGTEIAGATDFSYSLTNADLGAVLQCRVTATNADGSVVAISGPKYVSVSPPAANAGVPIMHLGYLGIFGGRVFFSDNDGDPANLFVYDTADETLTTIAGTGDARAVNIAKDGSHAYFTSPSEIGGEGTTGAANLYVWSAANESTKFIAELSADDVQGYNAYGTHKAGLASWYVAIGGEGQMSDGYNFGLMTDHSRTTPDGSVLVFESRAQLTSFDNAGHMEVYRYDTISEHLDCVSCPEGSGPATKDGYLLLTFNGFGQTQLIGPNTIVQNVTDDGQTVVFASEEGLVPRDGNEVEDVYEWKAGEGVSLISTGQSLRRSSIYAMTSDASDIIFQTYEPLLPQDENGDAARLYDARVNGGFPPPESSVTERCSGDTCQGAPNAAPESPRIVSSSINGAGNVPPKIHCRKGKRRVVRHGKEVCVHRKHRKHRKHRRHHHRAGSHRRAAR